MERDYQLFAQGWLIDIFYIFVFFFISSTMTLQRGVRGSGSFDQTRTLPRKLSEYRPPLSYEDADGGGFYDYNGEEYAKNVDWRGEDGVGGPCGEDGARDPLLQASISSLLLAAHQESVL